MKLNDRIEDLQLTRNWLIAFVIILIIALLIASTGHTVVNNTGITLDQCADAMVKVCTK
jgi:hypothetical protein